MIRSYGKPYGFARNGAGVACNHSERLDEAQLEASAKSFKFKSFTYKSIGFTDFDNAEALEEADSKLKALCQEFKDVQLATSEEVWSDISHGTGCWYVAYCKAGQLAVEAVSEAGIYYRAAEDDQSTVAPHALDLTAGYIVGRSWASCH